jgi:hypothetical protein
MGLINAALSLAEREEKEAGIAVQSAGSNETSVLSAPNSNVTSEVRS